MRRDVAADTLAPYGPKRGRPLGLDWVAVHRDRLRFGADPDSHRIPELLLDRTARGLLSEVRRCADAVTGEHLPVPVHPWQFDHVLPVRFAAELATGVLVPLVRGIGRFRPTASAQVLAEVDARCRVRLPLDLPDERNPVLRQRVSPPGAQIWCRWGDPDDRGRGDQLGVQVLVDAELPVPAAVTPPG
ncbi:IucA/IucC family protein [Saccharopolyspora sp. NPDC002686]|uniref:IucA/IucC family protein n=1 Tax=Saccharopolyspora sp. NPDC002686 TaxID=3154541 RepID=UPI00332CEB8C